MERQREISAGPRLCDELLAGQVAGEGRSWLVKGRMDAAWFGGSLCRLLSVYYVVVTLVKNVRAAEPFIS